MPKQLGGVSPFTVIRRGPPDEGAAPHLPAADGHPQPELAFRNVFLSRPSAIHRLGHASCAMLRLYKNDLIVCALRNRGTLEEPVVDAIDGNDGVASAMLEMLRLCPHGDVLHNTMIWSKTASSPLWL